MWSFNEEIVARAIYHSKIPVISAVGHETDYTISDFVADLRAPTPSAAAELVVKDKREIKNTLHYIEERLENQMLQSLKENRAGVFHLRKMLIDPGKKIEEYFLRMDDLVNRFRVQISWMLKRKRDRSLHLTERLYLQNPIQRVRNLRLAIAESGKSLGQTICHLMDIRRQKIEGIFGELGALSPLSILQRGYSITRRLPSRQILKEVTHVREGDKVEVRLHRGTLLCDVEKTEAS